LKNKGQRSSVSAEVYGKFNKKEDFVPRVVTKTEEQYKRILDKVTQSFLFNSLDDKDLNTVINAMEEKKFQPGEAVIRQGENGDVLYLIEQGKLDCFKIFRKGEEPTYLKTYQPGEAFGELALLYNAPRAATIISNEECLLWALDRETFNHIVKESAMRKRERYEKFLKSVNILSSMDNYEISQISDALKTEKVKEGEYIIRQNEEGDRFYIIEDGEAYASKKFEESIYLIIVNRFE
jgi:cAMP-dependent protein kinase regulator